MIEPIFVDQSSTAYAMDDFALIFQGFEGVGNVDEDGDIFYYDCHLWRDRTSGNHWKFHAVKIYESWTVVEAGFSKEEEWFVEHKLMEIVKEEVGYVPCLYSA